MAMQWPAVHAYGREWSGRTRWHHGIWDATDAHDGTHHGIWDARAHAAVKSDWIAMPCIYNVLRARLDGRLRCCCGLATSGLAICKMHRPRRAHEKFAHALLTTVPSLSRSVWMCTRLLVVSGARAVHRSPASSESPPLLAVPVAGSGDHPRRRQVRHSIELHASIIRAYASILCV
jgi:hypothetical protein